MESLPKWMRVIEHHSFNIILGMAVVGSFISIHLAISTILMGIYLEVNTIRKQNDMMIAGMEK